MTKKPMTKMKKMSVYTIVNRVEDAVSVSFRKVLSVEQLWDHVFQRDLAERALVFQKDVKNVCLYARRNLENIFLYPPKMND